MELGLLRGPWLSQGFREPGHRTVAERGARDLGSSYELLVAHSSSLRFSLRSPSATQGAAGGPKRLLPGRAHAR